MNLRREIREAVYDRISTKIIIDSDIVPVYKQRYAPLKSLPAIIIYTTGDTSSQSADQQANQRIETVSIIGYVKGLEEHEIFDDAARDAVIDKIDNLTGQIEKIFNKSHEALGGIVYLMSYTGTDIEIKTETEVLGVVTIGYQVQYFEQLSRI